MIALITLHSDSSVGKSYPPFEQLRPDVVWESSLRHVLNCDGPGPPFKLGLSISCWATFEQLFGFRATFFCSKQVSCFFNAFHDSKAPIKVPILDIGCFHHNIPFANNIYTLSDIVPALGSTASGGLSVVVLQWSVDMVKKFTMVGLNDSPCSIDHDK